MATDTANTRVESKKDGGLRKIYAWSEKQGFPCSAYTAQAPEYQRCVVLVRHRWSHHFITTIMWRFLTSLPVYM